MGADTVSEKRERFAYPALPIYNLWRKPFTVILGEVNNASRFKKPSHERLFAQNPHSKITASESFSAI
jgi:hypothetical protein